MAELEWAAHKRQINERLPALGLGERGRTAAPWLEVDVNSGHGWYCDHSGAWSMWAFGSQKATIRRYRGGWEVYRNIDKVMKTFATLRDAKAWCEEELK